VIDSEKRNGEFDAPHLPSLLIFIALLLLIKNFLSISMMIYLLKFSVY